MNRFILVVLVSLSILSLGSGQAKKFIFMEHFTNSKCSVCGSTNPGYYTTLKSYTGNYHHLAIHPSFPYPSCQLYQANTAENTARANYYTISSTPTVVIGGKTKKSASGVTTSVLNDELNKTSPIQIKVAETSGLNRTANIEVKVLGTVPAGSYKIFVAIAEKELNYSGGNGEKVHYDVFRKFASMTDGDNITLPAAGASLNLSYNYNVASTWVESQVYLLVWIQNTNTKEILNSGTKFDIVSSTQDVNLTPFTVFPNPAKDQINLTFDQPVPVNYNAVVTNIFGKNIKSGTIFKGANLYTVPVSELPKGTYFIRISNGAKVVSKKWIKI